MMSVNVMIVPGPGLRSFQVATGASLTDLVAVAEGQGVSLRSRNLVVQGLSVPTADWASFRITSGLQIFALEGTKGAL